MDPGPFNFADALSLASFKTNIKATYRVVQDLTEECWLATFGE